MSIFRCKMCGGSLNVQQGSTVCECEYCGTKQTVSATTDEVTTNLYNRANNLRIKCEFDKAQETYEKIIANNANDAEAYWGIVLCKYGIEYVEDPTTATRVPTCHRTQLESVLTDVDYLSAVNNADNEQKIIYEQEARAIDKLQKDILSIVHNEKPFDVFICYKETDENGKRTVDSTLANDIYYQLTQEGLKVFYAAITLENKLGQEYEPYIFAALNSAKVMLVVGTKPEYFDAVWVKNEWSRFLKLMKTDREKTLIPCFRDMDAYDLPDEFSHLQSQDMSKIGFVNDLVRGINKIVKNEPEQVNANFSANPSGSNINTFLKRVSMFLEDKNWKGADEYCEKVLDIDPECAEAYLGKLMAKLGVSKRENLGQSNSSFFNEDSYRKIMRFGSDELKSELKKYTDEVLERKRYQAYTEAIASFNHSNTYDSYKRTADLFGSLGSYKNSDVLKQKCLEKAEECVRKAEERRKEAENERKEAEKRRRDAERRRREDEERRKDEIYSKAKAKMVGDEIDNYKAAIKDFQTIKNWRDSSNQINLCNQKINEITEAIQRNVQAEIKKAQFRKKVKKGIAFLLVILVALSVYVYKISVVPKDRYEKATAAMEAGDIISAYEGFIALDGYKDSAAKAADLHDDYCKQKRTDYAKNQTIAAGDNHIALIKEDGTVEAYILNKEYDSDQNQCNVSKWKNIISISAHNDHTIGLKSDHTVISAGDNTYGQRKVGGWKNIVAVSTGKCHTVGLKSNGTVVATAIIDDNNEKVDKGQSDVGDWTDIVAVSAGYYHTVGLKSDGTVVAVGSNYSGECEVSAWEHIIAISAGGDYTIGLQADGTVLTTKRSDKRRGSKKHKIIRLKGAVAISTHGQFKVGLKENGSAVAVGKNKHGQCNVSDISNIAEIAAGPDYTLLLKTDGTIKVVGDTVDQELIKGIENIRLPADAKKGTEETTADK